MNLYDASDVERRAVFVEAAAGIGIRQDMIEKDFWVSWVLNRMFSDEELARIFLFKGGTSLSKAFNCIRRFSEDIDLLLALSEVSEPGESFFKERSRNAINTFKSKTGKRTAAYVKEILKPRLSALLAPYCTVVQEPDEPNNLYVKFPSVFSVSGYIRPDIKLEIGAFAEGTPFAPAKIRSYVSEQFAELPEASVSIPTVSIARTFWEKITVLHYLNFLPSEKATPMRRRSKVFRELRCLFVGLVPGRTTSYNQNVHLRRRQHTRIDVRKRRHHCGNADHAKVYFHGVIDFSLKFVPNYTKLRCILKSQYTQTY